MSILDNIRNTNLTTISSSEINHRDFTQPTNNNNPQIKLNNALVAKVLEDIIVEHCSKFNNQQSNELMSEVSNALNQVRLYILKG